MEHSPYKRRRQNQHIRTTTSPANFPSSKPARLSFRMWITCEKTWLLLSPRTSSKSETQPLFPQRASSSSPDSRFQIPKLVTSSTEFPSIANFLYICVLVILHTVALSIFPRGGRDPVNRLTSDAYFFIELINLLQSEPLCLIDEEPNKCNA